MEGALLAAAAAVLLCGLLPWLRAYRSLVFGAGTLLLITALIPRAGNTLGTYLFSEKPQGIHLPLELFGLAWWILGAWLVKSLLELVLRRTIFPNDNQPHARRLFADLASGFIYIVAFVGIIETVLKQPISTVIATSGVLAIVLGLALQNTLADVFSGLAINIDQPFRASDWITMNGNVEGEVMEINWRATRIRTATNEMIVIPNSLAAKAIVTNHRHSNRPRLCMIGLNVDRQFSPVRVIGELREAARACTGIATDFDPIAYASAFSDSLVTYQLYFGVDDFTLTPQIQSDVICGVAEALQRAGIVVGAGAVEVHLAQRARPAVDAPLAPLPPVA